MSPLLKAWILDYKFKDVHVSEIAWKEAFKSFCENLKYFRTSNNV